MPSLHEEFGYVAVEMASVGFPVVVNPKGGLIGVASNYVGIDVLMANKSKCLSMRIKDYLIENLLSMYENDNTVYSITATSTQRKPECRSEIALYNNMLFGDNKMKKPN